MCDLLIAWIRRRNLNQMWRTSTTYPSWNGILGKGPVWRTKARGRGVNVINVLGGTHPWEDAWGTKVRGVESGGGTGERSWTGECWSPQLLEHPLCFHTWALPSVNSFPSFILPSSPTFSFRIHCGGLLFLLRSYFLMILRITWSQRWHL